jgi:hypothetical protein
MTSARSMATTRTEPFPPRVTQPSRQFRRDLDPREADYHDDGRIPRGTLRPRRKTTEMGLERRRLVDAERMLHQPGKRRPEGGCPMRG